MLGIGYPEGLRHDMYFWAMSEKEELTRKYTEKNQEQNWLIC